MDKKPFDEDFPFKDDPTVRELFADGIHQVTVDGTTFRLMFTASRGELPRGNKTKITGSKALVARLVMPTPLLAELYNQLDLLVNGLVAQGIMKREGGGVRPTLQ
jgi:hypothetical protein